MHRRALVLVGICLFAVSLGGDFSRVPLTSKRAYGRVGGKELVITSARLKRLNLVKAAGTDGEVNDQAQVWALTLMDSEREGFVLYFTTEVDDEARAVAYRRPPVLRGTPDYRRLLMVCDGRRRSVPIGITSAQMLVWNPKTEHVEVKTWRDLFSAQLILSESKGSVVGQVLLVLPDKRRSFVTGAFKAPRLP